MTAPVERRHRELAYKAVEGCDYCGACPDGRNWIDGLLTIGEYGLELAIAQALADIEAPLLAEVERLPKWIPCSERMPIVSLQCNLCLAWDGGSVAYAHFDGKQFSDWSDELCRVIAGVTHWMPLPEPPK